MIRLVLADDHRIILEGLEQLFRRERDFQVLATVTSGSDALVAVRKHKPDVLVLDFQMPHGDGLSTLKAVRAENLHTRVVLLTATMDEDDVLDAMQAGVHGLVLKESAAVNLVNCVRRVAAGHRVLDEAMKSLLRPTAGLPTSRTPAAVDLTRSTSSISSRGKRFRISIRAR